MRTDILLKKTDNYIYDLDIRDGDIVVGPSDGQHKEHILLAYPGTFKQHPTIGVGVIKELNTSYTEDISRTIAINFTADGYGKNDISFVNDKLYINEA